MTYRFGVPGYAVIPPVKLHKIQLFLPKSFKRSINHFLNICKLQGRQTVSIGHIFSMDFNLPRDVGPMSLFELSPERADQLFDACVDICAIEGGYSSINKGKHVLYHAVRHDRPVVSCQLPTALDDPRDAVAFPQLSFWH